MEFKKIQGIIVGVLGVDEANVTPNARFVEDLGADSLDIYQIIMGLEEEFDIEIDAEEAAKVTTVEDVVEKIQTVIGE